MRKCMTDHLLDTLNANNGKCYPQIGYYYFANIRGDSPHGGHRSVYQIIGEHGGVAYAHELNDVSARKRCDKIREKIANS